MIFSTLIQSLSDAGAFPSDMDTAGRKARANESLEIIANSVRYLGSETTIAITVDTSGVITLPRIFRTIRGVNVDGYAQGLNNLWFHYLQSQNEDLAAYSCGVESVGGRYPTFLDPASACKLKIACSGETGGVRVEGLDQNGAEIYDANGEPGFLLTFNDASWSTQQFTSISAVVMPITTATKVLTAQYVSDSTTATLGIYTPSETDPRYTRYAVPRAVLKNAGETTAVKALVQRQHVPLVADADESPVDYVSAIKKVCLGIHYKDVEGDTARGDALIDSGISMLNGELRMAKANTQTGIRVTTNGSFGGSGLCSRF